MYFVVFLLCVCQVPYNFERVLFLFSGASTVQEFVKNYETNGKATVPQEAREKV